MMHAKKKMTVMIGVLKIVNVMARLKKVASSGLTLPRVLMKKQ